MKKAPGVLAAAARRLFPAEGDSLDPARGILYGVIASAIVWLVLYLLVSLVWRAVVQL